VSRFDEKYVRETVLTIALPAICGERKQMPRVHVSHEGTATREAEKKPSSGWGARGPGFKSRRPDQLNQIDIREPKPKWASACRAFRSFLVALTPLL